MDNFYSSARLEIVSESIAIIASSKSESHERIRANEILSQIKPAEMIDIGIALITNQFELWTNKEIMVFGVLHYWIIAIQKIDKFEKIKILQVFIENNILAKQNQITELILMKSVLRAKFQQLIGYMLCIIRPFQWESLQTVSKHYYSTLDLQSSTLFGSFIIGTLLELCEQLTYISDNKGKSLWQQHKINSTQRNNVIDDVGKYISMIFGSLDKQLAISGQDETICKQLPKLIVAYLEVLGSLNKLSVLSSLEHFNFSFLKNLKLHGKDLTYNTATCFESIVNLLCKSKSKRKYHYEYYAIKNYKEMFLGFIETIINIVTYLLYNNEIENIEKTENMLPLVSALNTILISVNAEIWYKKLPALLLLLTYMLTNPFIEFSAIAIESLNSMLMKLGPNVKKLPNVTTDLVWADANISNIINLTLYRLVKTIDYNFPALTALIKSLNQRVCESIGLNFVGESDKNWNDTIVEYFDALCTDNDIFDYIKKIQNRINNAYFNLLLLVINQEKKETVLTFLSIIRRFIASIMDIFDPKEYAEKISIAAKECPLNSIFNTILVVVQGLAKCINQDTRISNPQIKENIEELLLDILLLLTSKSYTKTDFIIEKYEFSTKENIVVVLDNFYLDNKTMMLEIKRYEIIKLIIPIVNLSRDSSTKYADQRAYIVKFLLKRILIDCSKEYKNYEQNSENFFVLGKKCADLMIEIYINVTDKVFTEITNSETNYILQFLMTNLQKYETKYPLFIDMIISIITSMGTYEIVSRAIEHFLYNIVRSNITILQSELKTVDQLRNYLMRPKRSHFSLSKNINNQFSCIENLCNNISIPNNINQAIKAGYIEKIPAHKKKTATTCDIIFKHPLFELVKLYLPVLINFTLLFFELYAAEGIPINEQLAFTYFGEDIIVVTCNKQKNDVSKTLTNIYNLPQYAIFKNNSALIQINKTTKLELQKVLSLTSVILALSISFNLIDVDTINELFKRLQVIFNSMVVPVYAKELLLKFIVKEGLLAHIDSTKISFANEYKNYTNMPQISVYLPIPESIQYGYLIVEKVINELNGVISRNIITNYAYHLEGSIYSNSSGDTQTILFDVSESIVNSYLQMYLSTIYRIVNVPFSPPQIQKSLTAEELQTIRYSRLLYYNGIVRKLFNVQNNKMHATIMEMLKVARIPLPPILSTYISIIKSYVKVLSRRIIPQIRKYEEAYITIFLQSLTQIFEASICIGLLQHDIIFSVDDVKRNPDNLLYGLNSSFYSNSFDPNIQEIKKQQIKLHILSGRPVFFNIYKQGSSEIMNNTISANIVILITEIYKCMHVIFIHFVQLKLNREILDKSTLLSEVTKYPAYKSCLLYFNKNPFNYLYSIPAERLVDMTKNLSNDSDQAVQNLCHEFIQENLKSLLL